MSGDIIKLGRFYPNESFSFSNGWLQSSKNRHHISSTRHFGESRLLIGMLLFQLYNLFEKNLIGLICQTSSTWMKLVSSIVCYRITHCHAVNLKVTSKGNNVSEQSSVQMVMAVTNYRFGSSVKLENLAALKSIWTTLT